MHQFNLRSPLIFTLILALVILPGSVLAAAARPELPAADFGAVDAYVESFMKENRVPGLALAIVQDDQIVHARGFGIADPSGQLVTEQTPFVIGSTSKAFTALAVMQLVEASQMELDAPVQRYLPWFQVGTDGASAAITVRQLLNHTSGIPEFAGENSQSVNNTSPDALEQQVRSLSGWSLAFAPGSAFEYANANYQTAGLIVQTVAGEPFETYVQQHIFEPLEMAQSFTSEAEAQAHGLARGYHYWFGIPWPAGDTPYARGHFPSSAFISSAEDLAHAMVAHLNGGQYAGRSLVSPAGLAELHRPVLDRYAMGWNVSPSVLLHDGAVATSGSQIVLDTQRKLGIVVVFNINNAMGVSHLYHVAPTILSLLLERPVIPGPTDSEYGTLLSLLGVLLVGEIVWLAWSWSRLRLWQRQPARHPRRWRAALWLIVPAIIELGLALYLWSLFKPSLGVALLYQPDLTLLALIICGLLVVWGALRTFAGTGALRRHVSP
jgi:CubicO group peptidase (beta-lactamase class C family)